MIKVELLMGVVSLVLCIFCLVEAISTPDSDIRNLPKVWWIILILLFPLVGSIAWLVAGRPVATRQSRYERSAPAFPEYDRPGRAAGATPESDEEFLKRVRERAEEQRRKAKEADGEPKKEDGES